MTLFHFREYPQKRRSHFRLTTEPTFSTEWLSALGNGRKVVTYYLKLKLE